MLKKIILSTAAVLVLTPLALAGHRDRNDYRPARIPSVVELSQELQQATRHVQRAAERLARPRYARVREALYALQRLDQSARQFHGTVEHRGHASRHVDRAFSQLLAAYDEAAYHVAHTRSRHLREDFMQVSRLIQRLTRGLDMASRRGRDHDYGDARADRRGSRGSVVFGDSNGRTRYRVRVGW